MAVEEGAVTIMMRMRKRMMKMMMIWQLRRVGCCHKTNYRRPALYTYRTTLCI